MICFSSGDLLANRPAAHLSLASSPVRKHDQLSKNRKILFSPVDDYAARTSNWGCMSPMNATKAVNLPRDYRTSSSVPRLSRLESTGFSLSFVLHWRPCVLCRSPRVDSNVAVIVIYCAEGLLEPFDRLHKRSADRFWAKQEVLQPSRSATALASSVVSSASLRRGSRQFVGSHNGYQISHLLRLPQILSRYSD